MSGTTPGGTLLVVDYPGRRDEARVADLDLGTAGWNVRHLLSTPLPREFTAREYAARLMERHPVDGRDVTAILAYCTGAPIAQEIAIALSGSCGPMPLVLFDGAPTLPALVVRDFRTAVTQVGGVSTADAARECVERLTDGALSEHPQECFDWMRRGLIELAARALRDDGLGADEAHAAAEDVCSVYLDWFAYLIAGHNTGWPAWRGEVLHVTSRRHRFVHDWPGGRLTRLHSVDADVNTLLKTPEARDVTLSFLTTTAKAA